MDNPELNKTEIITEINRMLEAWQLRWCETMLEYMKERHDMASKPEPDISRNGRTFDIFNRAHAKAETGDRSLCGRKNIGMVSIEEFENFKHYKCESCELSLRKLKGEDTLKNDLYLKRQSQEDVIIAVYKTAGRKLNEWVILKDLYPNTEYKTKPAMLRGLKSLERRGIVELKMKKHKFRVRLILDCIRETKSGKLIVSFDYGKF